MKNPYPKSTHSVKSTYTVRYGGILLKVRASHAEVLELLRILFTARQAA